MTKNIIIIGGGIIGLSTAWKLAKKGKKVSVFEKDSCLTGTSIVAPGALMPYNPSREDFIPTIQRQSLAMYPKFVEDLQTETGIDVKYTNNGRLQPIQSAHHLSKIQKDVDIANKNWQKVNGKQPMEILNADELKNREPALIPTEFGTLYCRVSGHVHSPLLMKALYEACIKNGVEILENTAVTSINTNNGVCSVNTKSKTYTADKILISAGAWSSQIFKTDFINEPEIVPMKGQVILVKTAKPIIGKSFIRARGLYLIQATPTLMVIGATKEPNTGFDITPTQKSADKMFNKAVEVIPNIKNCEIIKSFCGLRPVSLNSKAFMDKIQGYDNLYLSCGHGGIGICMAPVASEIMLEKLS